jgi:hypothetical protein
MITIAGQTVLYGPFQMRHNEDKEKKGEGEAQTPSGMR